MSAGEDGGGGCLYLAEAGSLMAERRQSFKAPAQQADRR